MLFYEHKCIYKIITPPGEVVFPATGEQPDSNLVTVPPSIHGCHFAAGGCSDVVKVSWIQLLAANEHFHAGYQPPPANSNESLWMLFYEGWYVSRRLLWRLSVPTWTTTCFLDPAAELPPIGQLRNSLVRSLKLRLVLSLKMWLG
ncbi:hypothetical protein E2C01_034720 [Portunus trituberculatus]|uniref:Uncharacterized protein n=1 Tax=Portunus trituberculatus TaxID=210409 RepID=A0A5B7F6A9_PORTR|nr:hypothetical protein [Portunus trituberculatus]